MRYLDEYRDPEAAHRLLSLIERETTRSWTLMEVCGGHTHSIVRHGIDELLPRSIELVHGPGCPVCVTSLEMIDRAHAIAARADVVFCSFGDMLRVPGSRTDLLGLKASGADVRVVYSPMDAVKIAEQNPTRQIVFFAIGFETTAPANAMAATLARRRGLTNFSLLVSHVLVPPAIEAVVSAPDNRVQAFLGPGHVCAVMGLDEYHPIAKRHELPIVVTGFEPVDLLEGILRAIRMLERNVFGVDNQYGRSVPADGNPAARRLVKSVFDVCDQSWRGIGVLPESGLRLNARHVDFDAVWRFEVEHIAPRETEECISGQILRGVKRPLDCPAFGTRCTPERPLGATMVSSEGACAAYHAYGRRAGVRGLPLVTEGARP
jgi:hydrogenase expression/formation protein HypD